MTPARAIADLRALGASDGYIARMIGVDPSTVHNWRHGQATPSSYALRRLRDAHRAVFGDRLRVVPGAAVTDGEARSVAPGDAA